MIRAARSEDVRTLAKLWHDAWHGSHEPFVPQELTRLRTEESFADRLTAMIEHTFLGADALGPMGFVVAKRDEIDQIFVAPRARGTGLAHELLAHGENCLAKSGTRIAHLYVIEPNARARAFYEKHGWRNKGPRIAEFVTSQGAFELHVLRYEKAL